MEKTLERLNLEMYAELAALKKEEARRNARLLQAIEQVRGREFANELADLLKDMDGIGTEWSIVRTPEGEYSQEDNGGQIKGWWCKQIRSSYCLDDSYSGYVYIELKPGRYLKADYSY